MKHSIHILRLTLVQPQSSLTFDHLLFWWLSLDFHLDWERRSKYRICWSARITDEVTAIIWKNLFDCKCALFGIYWCFNRGKLFVNCTCNLTVTAFTPCKLVKLKLSQAMAGVTEVLPPALHNHIAKIIFRNSYMALSYFTKFSICKFVWSLICSNKLCVWL